MSVILSLIHWNGCAFEMLTCKKIEQFTVSRSAAMKDRSNRITVGYSSYRSITQRFHITLLGNFILIVRFVIRISSVPWTFVRFSGGSLKGWGGGETIENNKNGQPSCHHLKPSSFAKITVQIFLQIQVVFASDTCSRKNQGNSWKDNTWSVLVHLETKMRELEKTNWLTQSTCV